MTVRIPKLGEPFDLRTWTSSERSVVLREERNIEYWGLITGTELQADGHAKIVVLDGDFITCGYPPPGGRKFGKGVKEWQFSEPNPDVVEAILKVQRGEHLRPPEPEPSEAAFGEDDDDNKKQPARPSEPARVNAARATRPK